MLNHKLVLGILSILILASFYAASIELHIHSASVSSTSIDPTTSATQLWKFTTTGSAYTPIITEDYVYVSSSFAQSSIANIYCLDASTGTQIWYHTSDKYGYTQPVVASGIAYTSSGDIVYAFNASTGAIIWNATGRIGAITGSYAYVDSGDSVYALDATTGTIKWEATTEGVMNSLVADGGKVYRIGHVWEGPSASPQFVYSTFYCYDALSGVKIWDAIVKHYSHSPVVVNDVVYVSYTDHDGSHVVASGVFALNAATGNQVWDYTLEGAVSSSVVAGGMLYVGSGDGAVNALNASSGEKIWNYSTDGSAGSPVLLDPYLYVSVDSNSEYEQASLYCLDASTGARIWNFTTEPGNAASSPVVVDGQVFVGNTGPRFFAHPDHYVYALDASTGEQIWNYTIEGNAGSLTVADGVVYVGASFASTRSATYEGNGAVYALKSTTATDFFQQSTIIVIVFVVVVVILAVVLLAYRARLKRTKG